MTPHFLVIMLQESVKEFKQRIQWENLEPKLSEEAEDNSDQCKEAGICKTLHKGEKDHLKLGP